MEFLNPGLLPLLWATTVLILIMYSCEGIGRSVMLGRLGADSLYPMEVYVFSAALGLAFFSLGFFFLGACGFLSKRFAVLYLGCFCAIAFFVTLRVRPRYPKIGEFIASVKIISPLFFMILIPIFLSWIQCASPPLGNDALSYHLAHPREFILQGKIGYLPDTRESLWPYLTEMLFTAALLLNGTTLAQLFHWIFFILTTALIYSFCLRFYDRLAALAAVLIFVFTPAAFAQASEAYVDLALTFFIFAAFYAFALADTIGERRASCLSGVLCGAALSTKYLAIGSTGFLFFLWAFWARQKWRTPVVFTLSAVLVSAVWYIRSWVVLGNPTYPFLNHFFGGRGFDFTTADVVGMGNGLESFLFLAWNLTMHPKAFGGEIVGPLFLAFVPLSLLRTGKPRPVMMMAAVFIAAYGFFIFTQLQQARFFVSLTPFLAVAAAVGVRRSLSAGVFLKVVSVVVLSSTVVLHTGIFLYRVSQPMLVLLGRETAPSYLLRREAAFKGQAFLNNRVEAGEKVLNTATPRRFYSTVPKTVYYTLPLQQRLGGNFKKFLDEQKFTYIWLIRGGYKEIEEYVAQTGYQEVFSYLHREGPLTYDYRIYQLKS